jgi:UDP-glucuronate 4-epimerase
MLYVDTNIGGTQKVIEAAEKHNISKVIYASSSCVMYGNPIPWSEKDTFRHHESPYGWTKFVNECQFLSSLVTSVGLRFFTVYGPYGRPDMALWSFADKIVAGEPIDLYNHGNMKRDFTYIDDIVTGVIIAIETQFEKKHEILNIGNGESVELVRFVDAIEKNLERVAIRNLVDVVPGEALESLADISKIRKLGYEPTTSVEEGVAKFIAWYKQYRHIN